MDMLMSQIGSALLIEIKLTKIVFEVLMNPRPVCRYCSTQTDFKPVP